MAASDFDDFCAQMCAQFSLGLPALAPDANGTRSFTITYRDTEFGFIERKRRSGDSVSMLVRFGAPPPGKAARVRENLMGANFMMMSQGAAAFVESPTSGDIFLHRMMPLAHLHVAGLPAVLGQFAAEAERFRSDGFLEEETDVDVDMPRAETCPANLA